MRRSLPTFFLFLALFVLTPSISRAQPAGGKDAGSAAPAQEAGSAPSTAAPASPPAPATGSTPSVGAGKGAASAEGGAAAGAGTTGTPVTVDRADLLGPGAPAPVPAPSATVPEPKSRDRLVDVSLGANPKQIYAEDWWVHSRPVLELHGHLRVRAELLHGFSLGRADTYNIALWPQPPDNSYVDLRGNTHSAAFYCQGANAPACNDKSQAGANMRLRVNPELHISDNLRIISQIDMLDNLVLGSTPAGFLTGQASPSPYYPIGALANTQIPPIAGVNSITNSIAVKRAWGEYATPLGQVRFGRMPSHWGLGILENSGDGYDSDWQSTVDRIMFTTGIKSLDLYASGAWDFPNEGPTSASLADTIGGQAHDLAQLDDVNQYVLMVARRRDPELAKGDLARGELVLNGGAYFAYRDQLLGADVASGSSTGALSPGIKVTDPEVIQSTYYGRRDFRQFMPDIWVQLLYKKLRFEAEGVMIAGSIGSLRPFGPATTFQFRQFGLATQTELKAIEDRLRLQFGFGWASGDAGLVPDPTDRSSTLSPAAVTASRQGGGIYGSRLPGDNTYREFRFHPDYRIDLILNRNILGRVQGEYYVRPSVDYDFTRTPQGQKLGGGAAIIWTRASEFIQSPGHKRDLGLEFDLSLYYQSKDGSLNDDPDKMGGFFTMLQYGVLFPLGGLSYLPGETRNGLGVDTSAAHTIRWFLGVLY